MSKTLEQAQKELKDRLRKGPTICPCCRQQCEIIRMEITRRMCNLLEEFYSKFSTSIGNVKVHWDNFEDRKLFKDLENWALIKQAEDVLYTYKVTGLGEDFLNNAVDVPAWIILYDGSITKQPERFSSFNEITRYLMK